MSWIRSVLGALVALFLMAKLAQAGDPSPNVLLVCVDDLKPTLGCYGDEWAITPNIDRLAAHGMRFDRAYCNQAVCAPSRNNLMLGSRSTSIGVYGLGTNFRRAVPDAITMTQHFMQHGYRAEGIGKIFHSGHGNTDDTASWSVPFQKEKVVEYLKPVNSANGQLTREEAYFSNQMLGKIRSLPRGHAWESAQVRDTAYADGRIADEGIERLRAAKERAEPFFLALGFVKPHLPFTAPQRYWDLHDPEAFPLPTVLDDPEGAPQFAGKRGGEILNYAPLSLDDLKTEETQRQLIHGFYACVSYVDAQIGRVLDELDRLQLADETLIVLWGDHGWHLGDHGYWTKHTNYEQATRIPILIVAPGVTKPGDSTDHLTETVDLFPTLAELAGLPAPQGPQPIDGVSLVPVLKDPTITLRDYAYGCFPKGGKMGRAIRTDRYRLVEWKPLGKTEDTPVIELYDYRDDPNETRNLARVRPEIVSELCAILGELPEALPRP